MTHTGQLPPRPLLDIAASVGRALRPAHAERLGAAMTSFVGPHGTDHLAHLVPAAAFTQQATRLLDAWATYPAVTGTALGSAVAAASHAHEQARRNPSLELVVSGPGSTVLHARRTEQVLLQLINEAQHEIVLVTFALHMHKGLRTALAEANVRGVRLTVLAEDHQDNHTFTGNPGAALAELIALRLRWPAAQRPALGAALHAKIVIIDSSVALITSANLTKRAAGDNFEAGLLVRGGDIAERLSYHIMQLRHESILQDV
ncbi:DISARM system phospholipase D-like protein DrmC [Amycolatopsis sp. NPDC051128]|uniref:DISARM system phospholipase D-like protein DrmC n=1 Tax=Amycolatopsis sp. NPDC051128 TaxID=3155412 RepID=UPI003447C642